jgi:hypothetical protein
LDDQKSFLRGMAGTTGLEPAISAVTCEDCAGVGWTAPKSVRLHRLQEQRPTIAAPAAFLVKDGTVAADRCREPVSGSTQPGEQSPLLSVGLGDLADELSPAHIHGRVDLAGLRSRIVFEDFHYQGRVVRNDDARL